MANSTLTIQKKVTQALFGFGPKPLPRTGPKDRREKILITGTGRAGTTLLVQLFTVLDFDTGYSVDEAMTDIDPISKAGLERLDTGPDSPYVIKSPIYADLLPQLLQDQRLHLRATILPMRDLYAAAQSRRRVTAEAIGAGGAPDDEHPGGLWLTRSPEEQEAKLAAQFYKIMHTLTTFGVTPITLEFPRFARDEAYLHQRLLPVLRQHGVSRREFRSAFAKVVQTERIHEFPPQGMETAA